MEEVILFFMTFFFLFLIYQMFFIGPLKKKYKNKEERKELLEIRYLQLRYHLDLDKISYVQLLQLCSIASSFDISIVVSVVSLIQGFFLKIVIGFVMIFLLIISTYHLVYLFYRKKGMIKNGKYK